MWYTDVCTLHSEYYLHWFGNGTCPLTWAHIWSMKLDFPFHLELLSWNSLSSNVQQQLYTDPYSVFGKFNQAATAANSGLLRLWKICRETQIVIYMELAYMTGQEQSHDWGAVGPREAMEQGGEADLKDITQQEKRKFRQKEPKSERKITGNALRTSLWEREGEGEKNEVCGFFVCPTMVMYHFLKKDGGTNMSARLCRPRASVGVYVFGTVVFSWSFILLSLLTFLSFSLPLQSPLFPSFLLFPSSCGAGGRLQVLSNVRAMYYQWSTL